MEFSSKKSFYIQDEINDYPFGQEDFLDHFLVKKLFEIVKSSSFSSEKKSGDAIYTIYMEKYGKHLDN